MDLATGEVPDLGKQCWSHCSAGAVMFFVTPSRGGSVQWSPAVASMLMQIRKGRTVTYLMATGSSRCWRYCRSHSSPFFLTFYDLWVQKKMREDFCCPLSFLHAFTWEHTAPQLTCMALPDTYVLRTCLVCINPDTDISVTYSCSEKATKKLLVLP